MRERKSKSPHPTAATVDTAATDKGETVFRRTGGGIESLREGARSKQEKEESKLSDGRNKIHQTWNGNGC